MLAAYNRTEHRVFNFSVEQVPVLHQLIKLIRVQAKEGPKFQEEELLLLRTNPCSEVLPLLVVLLVFQSEDLVVPQGVNLVLVKRMILK